VVHRRPVALALSFHRYLNRHLVEQNTSQDIKYLSEIKIASYYERNLKEKFKDTKRAI
jgi:hypothetical protein